MLTVQALLDTPLSQQRSYTQLLMQLDEAAEAAMDTALADVEEMNEPSVARELSRLLPTGVCVSALDLMRWRSGPVGWGAV